MVVRLEPVEGPLSGFVPLPCSKSVSARQIVLGLHAGSPFTVEGLSEAEDTQALIRIVHACGYRVEQEGQVWTFTPKALHLPELVEVGEGGTTLRFLLPWLSSLPGRTEVRRIGRLNERPLLPLLQALSSTGARIEETAGTLRLTGNPHWQPEELYIDASLSGQFLSALFLMAPRLSLGSQVIETSGKPATLSYVEKLTLNLLARYGYRWEQVRKGHWVLAEKPPSVQNFHFRGEADWSGGGYFWGWAMLVSARSLILPLSAESMQPECAFWLGSEWPVQAILSHEGLALTSEGEGLPVWQGDIEAVPDVFPMLSVLGALAEKPWEIWGIRTLPHKESDRLWAMQAVLSRIGARMEWNEDCCRVYPTKALPADPLYLDPQADHRIAMALSLLAARARAPLYIRNARVVSKSFPAYWEALRQIGISLTFEA